MATDERTPFLILRKEGLGTVRSAPTNDPALRIEAVTSVLTRLVEHRPCLAIDPRCVHLIKGFSSGYCYRRMKVSGERYEDKPDKNAFSHVHDALQYGLCGGGESRKVLSSGKARVVNGRRMSNPFERQRLARRAP